MTGPGYEDVLVALAHLTPRQRQCWELHYRNDLSYAAIGRKLGIAKETARDHVKKAQDRLAVSVETERMAA